METTTSFSKHIEPQKKIVVSQGGTNSAKSYTIIQLFILIAEKKKNNILSVIMADIPTLKRGVMRDFKNIMGENYDKKRWNGSDRIYTFKSGSILEFLGADSPDKLKVGKRQYAFLDECNNIRNGYEVFQQVNLRTSKKVFLSYNPSSIFWVHNKIIPMDNCDYIQTTYKDNEFCEPEIIKEIENLKITNPEWYKVYGLGETGSLQNTIFEEGRHWDIINEMPENYEKRIWGLDLGFENSYTALVECRLVGKDIYVKEHLYKLKMETPDYYKELGDIVGKKELILADVDKRLKADMNREGFNFRQSDKGPGSIMLGINKMKEFNIHITASSSNFINEMRGYIWQKDRQGDILNIPISDPIHCGDALRMVVYTMFGKPRGTIKML